MVDSIGPKAIVNYWVAIAHINLFSALNTHGESIYIHVLYLYGSITVFIFVFDSIHYEY